MSPVGRWLTTALGVLCVALATAGVFLPVLPTTIFLIAAVALFGRSCPELRRRVLDWRLFRPFRPYVEREKPMPVAARNGALASMWVAIAISSAWTLRVESLPDGIVLALAVTGAIGTVAILRAARRPAVPPRRP